MRLLYFLPLLINMIFNAFKIYGYIEKLKEYKLIQIFIESNPSFFSFFELILNVVALPVYLIILSVVLKKSRIKTKYQRPLILMIIIIILNTLISFGGWGLLTGNLFLPDKMTITIFFSEAIIGIFITCLVWWAINLYMRDTND